MFETDVAGRPITSTDQEVLDWACEMIRDVLGELDTRLLQALYREPHKAYSIINQMELLERSHGQMLLRGAFHKSVKIHLKC